MPSYRKVSELQSFTVNASRLHSRKSRVEARRDVYRAWYSLLELRSPELALELFNLVPATPRAAIGQLESTRRATFLGGSSLRGQDWRVGAIPWSVIGPSGHLTVSLEGAVLLDRLHDAVAPRRAVGQARVPFESFEVN